MRVLLLCPHFAEYSLCLARALAREHEVLLVLNERNFDAEIGDRRWTQEVPNLRVEFTPHDRSLRTLLGNIAVYRRLFRAFKPDVVHCQEELKDYLLFFIPFIGSTPMVLTVHDPRPHAGADARRLRFSRRRFYESALRRRANGVIVHGKMLQAQVASMPQFDGKAIAIAPHGPLGLFDARAPGQAWTAGQCLFFGRIEAYKGLDNFIDAIELLRADGIPAHGVVAGRGDDLERHRGRLAQTGFSVIERFLSPAEAIDQFEAAQVVVLPYHEATQSGVAAYALGRGRAIVATRVGSLPEMLDEGQSGLLVPPGDPRALANAIAELVTRPANAQSMATHALALGQGRLSWRGAATAATQLYQRLAPHAR
ncbi:MAG TPA: glycosyltransferase family 4 protein [Burkholderiaceae bacterium]|jgi:glycosyltransferase involved in cell wall biosynthesis